MAETVDWRTSVGDSRFVSIVGGALLGAAITRIASLLLPLSIGPFMLHLSLLAMIALCAIAIEILAGGDDLLDRRGLVAFGACSGVILDETLWLIVRNPPLLPNSPPQVGYWSMPSIIASSAGLLALAAGTFAASRAGRKREAMPPLERKHHIIAGAVLIGGLVFFHVSQAMLRHDVPNAERSLLIQGYEIHHLVEGQYLLMAAVVSMVFIGGSVWAWRLSFAAVLVGALFVADEILYYQLADVSDDAYFEAITIVSGGVVSAALLVQLIIRSMTVREGGGADVEG